MARVVFIGLGLNDEKGMSVEGLEEAQSASKVFAEFYTNTMPNLNIKLLEQMVGKEVSVLTRVKLEDENGQLIVEAATRGSVAFLVPGDPMIATTHISLRLALVKQGISTKIIHASSITSAVCGAAGLQSFKFGKSITLPQSGSVPGSVLDTVRENKARGVHTLLLLDVGPDSGAQLTVNMALARLVSSASEVADWLAVGVARLGSPDELVRAGRARHLGKLDFGKPPHTIVFPGRLHFMEAEALRLLADAQEADLEGNL